MSSRSFRSAAPARLAVWAALVAAPPAFPAFLWAQRPAPPDPDARIQGVVVQDAQNVPVAGATVSLVGTDVSVQTDWLGSFALPGVPVGEVAVRVSAPGRPSVVQNVFARDGSVVFLRVELPPMAAVLAEMLVEVPPPATDPYRQQARTATDLVAREVPALLAARPEVGSGDAAITLRAATTLSSSAPTILIDGIVVGDPQDALRTLDQIPAGDVESIRVLKGPAAASRYPLAANGVIEVWTRRGGGR